ncbi:MAG: beta-ketoacyl-[acyl-carrier-protein] synthase II [Acidobacteria bacterium]|nr:MAG: beta-ketoacyl-[acyl-carrier-protein] synthase II [Acidobacteria bacterium 13_1_40CM_4_58_4]PYT59756.1 MAG: beta-ketoacyl-[acyl-carrier-protein] synthase II [Acidobacteriota bacterium]
MTRRVVVTGVGLVCALGIGTEESWKNLVGGCSGVALITHFDTNGFDCKIAGEVKNFDPFQWIEKKELKKMARFIQLALAGADFAVKMSDWKPEHSNLDDVGVYVSSGIGGFDIIEREHGKLLNGGPNKISPFFIPSAIVNLASGNISIRYGARGPNSATATACSASAHAIGDSFKIIERSAAEMMICGGAEATITPMGVGGFAAMKALSTRNDDPARASRPWDAGRDGFVVGEGAGILILESLEHAQNRNAPIFAEIVGYGMSGDAYHITQPEENGSGAYRVMMAAIKDAKISPDDIGYVNAHGTSTPIGDVIETRALKRVFGERAQRVPVSSTKSMTGHLLGGAGGLEAGISVLALRDQILPPTINHQTPDPECDLDYVPNHARKAPVEYALSNSFGFGGTNAALIFRRWSGK